MIPFLRTYPRRLIVLLTIVCAAGALGGCHWLTPVDPLKKPTPPSVNPHDGTLLAATSPSMEAGRFAWEGQVLETVGRVEGNASRGPSGAIVARARAKTSGIRELLRQVRGLPVNGEASVGRAMTQAIAVNRAVEDAVKTNAITVSEEKAADGGVQLRLQLPLDAVAAALRANYITPGEPLPEPPATDPGRLSPVI